MDKIRLVYCFDAGRQDKAREYARTQRWLFLLDLGLGAVFLVIFLFSGFSVWLRDLLRVPFPVAVGLFFAVFMVLYTIITFPVSLYGGFVLPRRYGLSKQTPGSWLFDMAKGALVGLALGLIVVEIVYWLLSSFPDIWWLWAAAFMLVFFVLLTNLAPVLLLPLFFKLKPLEDQELVRRLTQLVEKTKTRVRGVFVMDLSSKSTAANAALAGLGNTRRVILADTLLEHYSPEEIEVILAHELGHHVHGDIAKSIVVESFGVLVGLFLASRALDWSISYFGFRGISDLAAFPLLVLVLSAFALIVRPLGNAYSRHIEAQADEFALETTKNPRAFTSMMTKLTDQNLSEAQPARWVEVFFYDHPPSQARIRRAQEYAGLHTGAN